MTRPKTTLLVVDDDELNRDALSRLLRQAGYGVLAAASGREALDLVNANGVDAVLLDVMMPGMSGLDTLRELRRTRSVSELPVLMVTAVEGRETVVEALDLGANDYVTKPIDISVTLARIRTLVKVRHADPLTGLPNRLHFMEKLGQVIARRRSAQGQPFAVLFLDIDRFKVINESLGHAAGDEVLVEMARRIEKVLRSSDLIARLDDEHTVARMGGDEFIVLLHGVKTSDEARAVSDRLRQAIAQPLVLQGREVVTSASVGIVSSASRYRKAEDMVRDADMAMYRAKERGKARAEVFETSMLAAAEQRLQLEGDLRHALERRQFELYYQPIVSLADAQLSGFEALLRWHHPVRGIVQPSEFIPIAEETGAIVPIGRWVLHEACRQMRAWEREFPETSKLIVSVNLSARQCLHTDLVSDVRRILAETGLPPARVKLEVTEGVVMENSDVAAVILKELRAIGVQLGLDDFGMGYSSLRYLQRFPFQTIKIDRAFVSGIHETSNTEIIRAITALASGLEMNITAEGVETVEQIERLKALACDHGQGFYFHKPLTPADAQRLLRAGLWSADETGAIAGGRIRR